MACSQHSAPCQTGGFPTSGLEVSRFGHKTARNGKDRGERRFAVVDPIRQALALLADRIELAMIYGSVPEETDTADSDIDLLIGFADGVR